MRGCLEQGRDLSQGLKYNNLGIHGACSANAADALAAVKQFVFEEHSLPAEELLAALQANFAGYEPLRRQLDEDGPKVGSNDNRAMVVVTLFEAFAIACEEYGRVTVGRDHPPGRRLSHVLPLAGRGARWYARTVGCSNRRWPVSGETLQRQPGPRARCACAGPHQHPAELFRRSTISAFAMAAITMELF